MTKCKLKDCENIIYPNNKAVDPCFSGKPKYFSHWDDCIKKYFEEYKKDIYDRE